MSTKRRGGAVVARKGRLGRTGCRPAALHAALLNYHQGRSHRLLGWREPPFAGRPLVLLAQS